MSSWFTLHLDFGRQEVPDSFYDQTFWLRLLSSYAFYVAIFQGVSKVHESSSPVRFDFFAWRPWSLTIYWSSLIYCSAPFIKGAPITIRRQKICHLWGHYYRDLVNKYRQEKPDG